MRSVLAITTILGFSLVAAGQGGPEYGDLLRLSEAFRLARAVRTLVWPGWDSTPFPVLLVTADQEFLARSLNTPNGFATAGYSAILQTEILRRPRQFDAGLLATLPVFGPSPVVIIGRAEVTKKTSTAWVLTVLHEHFHQYQMSDPRYFSAVDELELSGGDQTGMWMLNYPFPYRSVEVAGSFAALSRDLANALERPSRPDRQRFWQAYAEFLERLSVRDRRYLSFQAWQEGVARYVELRVAEIAAGNYTPSLEFQSLPDSQTFAAVAAGMRAAILRELTSPDLRQQQRVSLYAFGAGLALLLDQDGDAWRSKYLSEKFFMERYVGGTR